jgi:hypothetical protein
MAKLRYAQARRLIRSGDLIAWAGSGPVGLLIRLATSSSYSHCGIAWRAYGRLWVLEVAEPWGGRPPRAVSHRLPFTWVPTDSAWTPAAAWRAFDDLDCPYSFLDALRAWRRIALKQGNGMICSEYCRDVLLRAGVDLGPDADDTPGGLVTALARSGRRVVEVTA